AITVSNGNSTIAAPLTTNKVTNITANGNTLSFLGPVLNSGTGGIVNTGSGTLQFYAGPNTSPSVPATTNVTNRSGSKIENAGAGRIVMTANAVFSPAGSTTVSSNSINNDNGAKILNSGSGNLTINLITTADLLTSSTATTRNAAAAIFVNNGTVENSG